jgi:hypothetical protein
MEEVMREITCNADTSDLIVEKMIAWGQDDEVAARYPNRSHFVAANDPEHGEYASTALGEGDPVVLVFPGGDEILIEPGENGDPVRVEARDASGQPLAA